MTTATTAPEYATTLSRIKEFNPCTEGWHKLLHALGKTSADDEPVAVEAILESNGLAHALWALRAVDGAARMMRLLACDFATRSLPAWYMHHPGDHRPAEAIVTARLYADGRATADELDAARKAARDAGWTSPAPCASDAARACGWACGFAAQGAEAGAAGADALAATWDAAAWADGADGWEAACEWQEARLRKALRGEIY